MKVLKTIGLIVTLILLALLMSQCRSAQAHLNLAIKKDPSILDTTRQVSIDTLIIETPSVDTSFVQVRDTLITYVQKDSIGREIQIKYLWNTETDSVFIEADCPDPEIITRTETQTIYVTKHPAWWSKTKWILIALFAGLLLFRAIRFFR